MSGSQLVESEDLHWWSRDPNLFHENNARRLSVMSGTLMTEIIQLNCVL